MPVLSESYVDNAQLFLLTVFLPPAVLSTKVGGHFRAMSSCRTFASASVVTKVHGICTDLPLTVLLEVGVLSAKVGGHFRQPVKSNHTLVSGSALNNGRRIALSLTALLLLTVLSVRRWTLQTTFRHLKLLILTVFLPSAVLSAKVGEHLRTVNSHRTLAADNAVNRQMDT